MTDPRAQLAAWYTQYRKNVFGLSYRLMGQHVQDAEDLTQTAFLHAYAELRGGAQIARPLPWLLAIAHGEARDVWRTHYRRPTVPYAPMFDDWRGTTPPADAPLWTALIRQEIAADLERRLALCTAEQRRVLFLLAAGWDYPRIARHLGKTHQAVKSLICRARRTAREGRGVWGPK